MQKVKKIEDLIKENTFLNEIVLKIKDGVIQSAEASEHIPLSNKKYAEILNEKSDQTLLIKRQKGKDSFIKRTFHIFFNN